MEKLEKALRTRLKGPTKFAPLRLGNGYGEEVWEECDLQYAARGDLKRGKRLHSISTRECSTPTLRDLKSRCPEMEGGIVHRPPSQANNIIARDRDQSFRLRLDTYV